MADAERRCILTKETAPKQSLIRFVLSPSGDVIADLAAKLPGRGASVTPDRQVLEEAITKGKLHGAFSRAFATRVTPQNMPDQLLDALEKGLHRRCADRLGQAQRSGDCVTGFDKINAAMKAGAQPGLLLIADDAGADGVKKMTSLIGSDVPVESALTRETLSIALGTGNSVHVLIRKGRNADLLIEELTRFAAIKGAS